MACASWLRRASADIGCSEEEIKAITGHKSSSEVARYTKARDQKRLAESASGKLKHGEDDRHGKRTTFVQPAD